MTIAVLVLEPATPACAAETERPAGASRPRLLVLTDIGGDPDDQQSLIRLMLHANEFEIEGLIASASGTPGELREAVTRPDLIRQIVEAYGQVQPRLASHAAGYPEASLLLSRIRSGNLQRGRAAIGAQHDTEGSARIIESTDREDPRPLILCIWGGQTDLAQALWRVRENRGQSGLNAFVQRMRVFDIADQDAIASWIVREFPGLFYVLSQARAGEDRREAAFRGMYLEGDLSLTSRDWLAAHVLRNHGPLGALYPTRTWTAPNPNGALKEGDTPSWFFFLDNGLNVPEHPEYGGWGGRYERDAEGLYRDAADEVEGRRHVRQTVARWRPTFQAELQARLDWCVQDPHAANHRPVAQVNAWATTGLIRLQAAPGQTLRLNASESWDPDQDTLQFSWWIYDEPSTARAALQTRESAPSEVELRLSPDGGEGEIHLILEVQDDGVPPLTAYRRIIVATADQADVVVYGGTSAGVMAAVQVARSGRSVILVCPDRHLGGLSSGGLGWTDTGKKEVIGGLAREFYHRVWLHYDQPQAWRWQAKADYGNRGQGTPAIDGAERTMWIFEPHVAETVFEDLVREHAITIHRDAWLDRRQGVASEGGRIRSITTLDGRTYRGQMFIDATYEGDLLAAAKVSYHVGREANRVYDESWNGIQVGVLHHSHHFKQPIDPYRTPGDPTSGLLDLISPEPPGIFGEGDHRVQAYCYRMCLSRHPDNRVPFAKPAGYDPDRYELLARVLAVGWREVFGKFDPIPNLKTDTNNHGPVSTDHIGMSYDYPEASYAQRAEILKEHTRYQQGLMYFLANDPRVPDDLRRRMSEWGLARDEFTDNGHWPHQIYVREARRMIGSYVMTEHDVLGHREVPHPVGMGSYTLDSHNVQRYVTAEGTVQNEGDIGVHVPQPYRIAYGALVPKKSECENLLVPVCVSSSHIAFGSIRMEPVFMILGQSAATAAVQAIEEGTAVQDIDPAQLRRRLLDDGQKL